MASNILKSRNMSFSSIINVDMFLSINSSYALEVAWKLLPWTSDRDHLKDFNDDLDGACLYVFQLLTSAYPRLIY